MIHGDDDDVNYLTFSATFRGNSTTTAKWSKIGKAAFDHEKWEAMNICIVDYYR